MTQILLVSIGAPAVLFMLMFLRGLSKDARAHRPPKKPITLVETILERYPENKRAA